MKRFISKEPCIVSGTKNYKIYSECLIENLDRGLIVAAEIRDEKELDKLYKKDYFFGMEYSKYIEDRHALEQNFKKRIKTLKKMGFIGPNKTVLEVGCAYGYFLNLVKDKVKSHKGFDVAKEGEKVIILLGEYKKEVPPPPPLPPQAPCHKLGEVFDLYWECYTVFLYQRH